MCATPLCQLFIYLHFFFELFRSALFPSIVVVFFLTLLEYLLFMTRACAELTCDLFLENQARSTSYQGARAIQAKHSHRVANRFRLCGSFN